MDLDAGRYLDGRSLADLGTEEVFVLAKVLPGFTGQKRLEAYKGVVREAMEEGYVNAASSLEVLRRMRQELGISDDEHRQLLEELGVEDPALLDPDRKRSLEDQVRLSGYRRSLERVLRLQGQVGAATTSLPAQGSARALAALRQQYGISPGEEAQTLDTLSATEEATQRAQTLLERMEALRAATASLHQPLLASQHQLVALLEEQLRHREELGVRAILECLAALGTNPAAPRLATRLQQLCPQVLAELLEGGPWMDRFAGPVQQAFHSPDAAPPASAPPLPREAVLQELERLVGDPLPTVAAAAAALSTSVDSTRGPLMAQALAGVERPAWVRQTAERLGSLSGALRLSDLPELEKRVVLATSDFFRRTWADTLDALADQAQIRSFGPGDLITEAGDTCRELLLLIEGAATVNRQGIRGEGMDVEQMRPGQVLDELEVLTHSTAESTIVAETTGTRVLAVPVDSFDATLERDPDFARRVLALETRQLQRLTRHEAGPVPP